MKKKSLLALTLTMIASLTAFVCMQKPFGVVAESAEVTGSSVISETVAKINNGETAALGNDLFEYSIVLATHANANTWQISETFSEKEFDLTSGSALKINGWTKPESPTALAGSPYGPFIRSDLVRFNYVEGVAFKIVAKSNIKLTVTHPAISGIVANDNVIKIRTYKRGSRLTETPLYDGTNTSKDANFFGGEYTLTSGETFYFEYGCTGTYEKSVTGAKCFLPTFTAIKDESTPDTPVVPEVKTLTTKDIVKGVYDNAGKEVTDICVTYGLYWGNLDDQKEFDKISGGTLQTEAKNGGNQYAAVFARYSDGLLRTDGSNQKLIYKFVPTENVKVTVSTDSAKTNNGTAYYNAFVKSGKAYRSLADEIAVAKGATGDLLANDFMVKGGSEFYYVVNGSAYGTNIYVSPTFTFDTESYEEKEITLTYADMFAQVIAGRNCSVEKAAYSFGLAYGEIDDLKTPVISGSAIKSTELNSSNWAAVYSDGTFVRTLGENLKFFVKITAKTNLNLTVRNAATETASSYKATYENYYSDGVKTARFGKTEVAKILEEDALKDTISLPLGSSYILGVYGINEGTKINQLPYFVLEEAETVTAPKIVDYVLNGGENSEKNAGVLYKGENEITLYPAAKTGYDFIGWLRGGKIYSANESVAVTEDLTFNALYYNLITVGGSLKLKPNDLKMRFVSEISTETIAMLDELNIGYTLGTLLLPSDMKNGALTVDTNYVSDNERLVWNGETDDAKRFNVLLGGFDVSGEITEIVKNRLERSISARAYLKITADGKEIICYGNEIERSAYEIAQSAYNDYKGEATGDYVNKVTINGKEVYSVLTEEQIAVLAKVLSAGKTLTTADGIGNQANLYGVCYNLDERLYTGNDYYDLEKEVALIRNLGVKSVRVWLHATTYLVNPATVNKAKCEESHKLIDLLKKNGIQVIAMSHTNFNEGTVKSGKPARNITEGAYYVKWLKDYYLSFKTLSAEFKNVDVWEVDNEINNPDFMKSIYADAETVYTLKQMADISADMLYYASRGIKESNKAALVLMGGITEPTGLGTTTNNVDFLQYLYDNIKSGNFGYFYDTESKEKASVNPDDYFTAVGWHPYIPTGTFNADYFVEKNNEIYQVVLNNEGKHKKVFFTEIGFSGDASRETLIAENVINLYETAKLKMPYVEAVNYYKMFNVAVVGWTGAKSRYGLFYDPDSNRSDDNDDGTVNTPGAPKKAAYAFQKVAGGKGDLTLLTKNLSTNSVNELNFGEENAETPRNYRAEELKQKLYIITGKEQ